MNRRTKKELIQIFKKLRESHAWSKDETGELSIIRERYEEGKEDEVHRLIGELDAKLGAKRLALLAALPQAQAPVQAAVRCGSPRKADRSRRHQGAHSPESRKARRTGGLFRMHQIHSQEVVQMNTQATESKAKEVWEAEQASAHTPLTGQDEDDIEVMKRDFDDVFPF